jgi:hypothetical protein
MRLLRLGNELVFDGERRQSLRSRAEPFDDALGSADCRAFPAWKGSAPFQLRLPHSSIHLHRFGSVIDGS